MRSPAMKSLLPTPRDSSAYLFSKSKGDPASRQVAAKQPNMDSLLGGGDDGTTPQDALDTLNVGIIGEASYTYDLNTLTIKTDAFDDFEDGPRSSR